MRSINVRIMGGAAALAAAASLGLVASAAAASTGAPFTVASVNTNSNGHEDTTYGTAAGSATIPSVNGPVWAIDTIKEHWTVAPQSTDPSYNYVVTMTTRTGSKFSEFADPGPSNGGVNGETDPCPATPGPGGPHSGTGTLTGKITYDINATSSPNLTNVPAVQAPNTSLGAVLDQIFGSGNYTTVGNTPYVFTYKNVCGQPFVENSAQGG